MITTNTLKRTEKKIVEVKSRMKPDQKPVKRFIGYADEYVYLVTYVLEDGTTINTYEHKRLQRDAKAELAKMPYVPASQNFVACFNENGEFWGTKDRYSLFG